MTATRDPYCGSAGDDGVGSTTAARQVDIKQQAARPRTTSQHQHQQQQTVTTAQEQEQEQEQEHEQDDGQVRQGKDIKVMNNDLTDACPWRSLTCSPPRLLTLQP
jgi:hypothetical protein